MNSSQIEEFMKESISFLRDLKLKSVLQPELINIEIPKKRALSFLYKSYKKIDELQNLGGILTGSRALKFYQIGGVPLLTRKADDWDVVISREGLEKFCANNGYHKNLCYEKDRLTINLATGVYVGSHGYHTKFPKYLFRHDIDIIGRNDLPTYTQCGKYKIANIEHIMSEKIKLISKEIGYLPGVPIAPREHDSKHISDCIEIMIKINTYNNPSDALRFTIDTGNFDSKSLNHMIKIMDGQSKEKNDKI